MKKLKLDLQSLNAEVLTRSQLKLILAGDGSTPACSMGSECSVYVEGVGTYIGWCGYTHYLSYCECITTYGDYVPNGGVSHCSPQL